MLAKENEFIDKLTLRAFAHKIQRLIRLDAILLFNKCFLIQDRSDVELVDSLHGWMDGKQCVRQF